MPSRSGCASTPDEGRDITRITELIKAAAAEQLPVVHPEQPGFAGITIGQLSGPAHDPANSRRNVVTVSTGDARLRTALDLDRRDRPIAVRDGHVGQDGRPPRQGPAGRRRRLPPRGHPRHGLHRSGRRGDDVGQHRAIVPTITGSAWITGFSSYVLDPTDPFPEGFTVGDIW